MAPGQHEALASPSSIGRESASETSRRARDVGRWYRPIAFALTAVIGTLAMLELAYGLAGPPNWKAAIGNDLEFYAGAAKGLFTDGQWFLNRELHGPFDFDFGHDVLYPPVAAWVFLAFNIIPVGALIFLALLTFVWLLSEWHPAPWTWPLLALCFLWPLTLLKSLAGTSTLFVVIALGLAFRFSWPSVLILMKPSFLPLAFIGVRRRGWWIGLGVLIVGSLPFLEETLKWPGVILSMRNPRGILYSVEDLPMILIPVIAWLGRTRLTAREPSLEKAVRDRVGRVLRRQPR